MADFDDTNPGQRIVRWPPGFLAREDGTRQQRDIDH
jgi:hypothetical protein